MRVFFAGSGGENKGGDLVFAVWQADGCRAAGNVAGLGLFEIKDGFFGGRSSGKGRRFRGKSEMVENLSGRLGRMDCRDQTKLATALAGEYVCLEYPLDQFRPGIILPLAFRIPANAGHSRCGRFGGLLRSCAILGGRSGALRGLCRRNDLRSPLRRWPKHPGVANQVSPGSWHQGREFFNEFQRRKHRVGRSIAPWRFEPVRQPAVGQLFQPFGG